MNIANTRVGTRLGIGFALVLLLLGGVTALGIMHMSQIQQRLEQVLTVNNVQSRLAGTMRNAVMDRMIALRNVTLVQNTDELGLETDRIREQERQYRSAEEQLEQMLSSSAESSEAKTLLAKVKEAAGAAQPLMNKTKELVQSQQTAEATRVLLTEVRPIQKQWLASLDDLVRGVDKQSIMYGFEASKSYETARNLMLTLGGIALLMGVAAAVAARYAVAAERKPLEEVARPLSSAG